MNYPLIIRLLVAALAAAAAAAAAAVGVSAGATIRGAILPSQALPNPGDLAPDTTITLTTAGIKLSALLRADNTFVFRNVTRGKSYILDTSCSSHHFAPLRVDVASSGGPHGDGDVVSVKQTFRGNAWSNTGEKRGLPIELRATKVAEYYVVREGFNLFKMLSSPMILIAIVSLVSIVFLPKVLDKMDPEFKAEFEAQRAKSGSAAATNPIANFDMASFLAGTNKPAAAASAASASDTSQPQQQQHGQKKRR